MVVLFFFFCILICYCHFLLPVCGRYAFVHVIGSLDNMFQVSVIYLVLKAALQVVFKCFFLFVCIIKIFVHGIKVSGYSQAQ